MNNLTVTTSSLDIYLTDTAKELYAELVDKDPNADKFLRLQCKTLTPLSFEFSSSPTSKNLQWNADFAAKRFLNKLNALRYIHEFLRRYNSNSRVRFELSNTALDIHKFSCDIVHYTLSQEIFAIEYIISVISPDWYRKHKFTNKHSTFRTDLESFKRNNKVITYSFLQYLKTFRTEYNSVRKSSVLGENTLECIKVYNSYYTLSGIKLVEFN